MNTKKQNVIKQCLIIGLGFFVILGMSINQLDLTGQKLRNTFADRGFLSIALMCFCYFALKPIVLEGKVLVRKLDVVLSMVISFFILVGKSFVKYSNFSMLTGNIMQVGKSILVFIAYSILVSVIVSYIRYFVKVTNFTATETKNSGILYFLFEKHPFLTPFLVILVVWMPFVILFYPGFPMGDTAAQIFMAFNMENHFALQVPRPNPDVWVTNQHSVLHTTILGVCMRIGRLLADSDTLGYFIHTLLQTTGMAATLAYAMSFLTKLKTAYFVRVSVFALYVIHPIFFTYAILGTKDTIFSCFVLLWLITIAKMVYDEKHEGITRKDMIICLVSIAGAILFRKNAYHMLILSVPLLFLVIKRMRKFLLISFLVVIAVQTLYIDVFLRVAQIADGSEKDMLSIPFMQTARYLRDHEEDVTEEQKAAINGVLDYEHIKKKYYPLKSDRVKVSYKDERTDEEFQAYIDAWFEMFLKHPICYVEATVENTYGYYCFLEEPVNNWHYSQTSATKQMIRLNKRGFHFDFLEGTEFLRNVVSRAHQIFVNLPLISFLMQCATYTWVTIFVMLEFLKKKRFKEFALYFPLLLLLGTCILSPVNGFIYFRYTYPVAFALPILLSVTLRYKNMEEVEEIK